MKRNLLFLPIFTTFILFGCTISQYVIYDVEVNKIYDIPGKTKNDLYKKTLKWIALTTNWSKSVIDYKDSSVATLVVKANISTYDFTELVYVPCIFEINIKDEKVNIIITNNDDKHTLDKDGKKYFKENLEDICKDYYSFLNKNEDF